MPVIMIIIAFIIAVIAVHFYYSNAMISIKSFFFRFGRPFTDILADSTHTSPYVPKPY